MNPTVEVRLAFAFDCPFCVAETFVHSVVKEFSREEKSEMEMDGESPQTGDWVTHPDEVVCGKCGGEFNAVNPGQTDDFGDT